MAPNLRDPGNRWPRSTEWIGVVDNVGGERLVPAADHSITSGVLTIFLCLPDYVETTFRFLSPLSPSFPQKQTSGLKLKSPWVLGSDIAYVRH